VAAVFLGCSILTTLACVAADKAGGACGSPQLASCDNGCVDVSCPTIKHTCTGSPTDYACQDTAYTASCSTAVGEPAYAGDGYGELECYCTNFTDTGGQDAPCYKVTLEFTGC
jgi:hypothetical protein